MYSRFRGRYVTEAVVEWRNNTTRMCVEVHKITTGVAGSRTKASRLLLA